MNVAPYVLHRDPRYFSPHAEKFWSDRWLPAEKRRPYRAPSGIIAQEDIANVTTDTSAFIPFSYGPANCAGRNLALLEMRVLVALLMQRFDIAFAPGLDFEQWEKEVQDLFVVKVSELPVILRPRT